MGPPGEVLPPNAIQLPPGYTMIRDEDLRRLVFQAGEAGATVALARLGLQDENAPHDIKDLRDWLKSWRTAKNTAIDTFVRWFVRGLIVVVIIGVSYKLGIKLPE